MTAVYRYIVIYYLKLVTFIKFVYPFVDSKPTATVGVNCICCMTTLITGLSFYLRMKGLLFHFTNGGKNTLRVWVYRCQDWWNGASSEHVVIAMGAGGG